MNTAIDEKELLMPDERLDAPVFEQEIVDDEPVPDELVPDESEPAAVPPPFAMQPLFLYGVSGLLLITSIAIWLFGNDKSLAILLFSAIFTFVTYNLLGGHKDQNQFKRQGLKLGGSLLSFVVTVMVCMFVVNAEFSKDKHLEIEYEGDRIIVYVDNAKKGDSNISDFLFPLAELFSTQEKMYLGTISSEKLTVKEDKEKLAAELRSTLDDYAFYSASSKNFVGKFELLGVGVQSSLSALKSLAEQRLDIESSEKGMWVYKQGSGNVYGFLDEDKLHKLSKALFSEIQLNETSLGLNKTALSIDIFGDDVWEGSVDGVSLKITTELGGINLDGTRNRFCSIMQNIDGNGYQFAQVFDGRAFTNMQNASCDMGHMYLIKNQDGYLLFYPRFVRKVMRDRSGSTKPDFEFSFKSLNLKSI